MRKPQSAALILICVLHAQSIPSPKDADIRALFTQHNDPGTTDHAAQQILRSDPGVRRYIVEKLPDMIAKPRMDRVWRNAVRLAGQLKASNSVLTLVQALPRSPFKPSIILFGEILSL